MPYASTRSAGSRLDHVHAGVKRGRRDPAWSRRAHRGIGVVAASTVLFLAGATAAAELLLGPVPAADDATVQFRLEAESRQDLVGGRIFLGEFEYEISKVSRLGLVGARRFVTGDDDGLGRYAEFLVFSSSYSDKTAVGTPWLAAREAYGCDKPYNSYYGFYRVEGESAVKALGPIPYPDLAEDPSRSQHSHAACFMARLPE